MSKRRLLARLFLALVICVLLIISPAIVFGRTPPKWAPTGLRNWAFDVRLTIAPVAKKLASVSRGAYKDDTVYVDHEGRDVQFESQGLTIVGTLYQPRNAGNYPGILLLHGSTPEGRRLGLYRILGRELAKRGYVVLSIDRRGYGDSDDPPKISSLEDLAPVDDFVNAIDYLASLDNVDPERLYAIGHSGGTDLAITGGICDSRVGKVVAIGPGRRIQERMGSASDPEWEYFQRRAMRYMALSGRIPDDIVAEERATMSLETHRDYFSSDTHKPLLLIDGSLESGADREFLAEFCGLITDPKECMTLEDSDHYANVANFGPVVIYDERVVEQLIGEIDAWLDRGFE